ncbi:MAG: phosphatidylserine decarboxylase [Hyphomicrobiaceae bacterium]
MPTSESLIDRFAGLFVPIHSDGHRFIGIAVVVTLLLALISSTLGWIGVIVTGWIIAFFRDPERVVPLREGLVVSAADGVVRAIDDVEPASELDLGPEPRVRVSVHLSLLDVHIQRVPMSGELVHTVYLPGTFRSVRRDKAHEDNERHITIIEGEDGMRVAMVQIAGGIRRRIVTFLEQGRRAGVGERLGLIRFGSRVDVYLPPGVGSLVAVGQSMTAGETVIADLKSGEAERTARAI